MPVNYDNFAKTFAKSRQNMKWEEINYFLDKYVLCIPWKKINILDIWCWNARLLKHLQEKININNINYLWIDLSRELIEQAKKNFPNKNFKHLNMLEIDKIKEKFDYIFFIASFHHLENIYDRKIVLKKSYSLLKKSWIIFMTNWALNSPLNKEKYKKSIIQNSKNKFNSIDYNIKIWNFNRFYHCFSLEELNYLFKENNFFILENRLFENQKNYISIIQKKD